MSARRAGRPVGVVRLFTARELILDADTNGGAVTRCTNRITPVLALAVVAVVGCRDGSSHPPPAAVVQAAVVRPDSAYVPILVYHGVFAHHPGQTAEQVLYDVAPQAFDAQMAYLRDHGFHVVPLAALVGALEAHDTLPSRSVVTLDDGPENQYLHAFPILQKYGYTATFFVYPNPILVSHADFMTWDQLLEMQKAGMTIGCHSLTHPTLTKIRDTAELRREIIGSRTILERHLHTKVDLFAFPFGQRHARVDSVVQAAGYRAARGFPGGGWNGAATLFAMRSLLVTDDMKAFALSLTPPPARIRPPG